MEKDEDVLNAISAPVWYCLPGACGGRYKICSEQATCLVMVVVANKWHSYMSRSSPKQIVRWKCEREPAGPHRKVGVIGELALKVWNFFYNWLI